MPSPEPAKSPPAAIETLDAVDEIDEWLVDGFNVLHAVILGGRERRDWWRREARDELLEAVATALPGRQNVQVVFDGDQPAEHPGPAGLATVFAPSADEWLVRRVKAAPQPHRLAVVTADRRLASRVRHAGARVVTPRALLSPESDAGEQPGDIPNKA